MIEILSCPRSRRFFLTVGSPSSHHELTDYYAIGVVVPFKTVAQLGHSNGPCGNVRHGFHLPAKSNDGPPRACLAIATNS
jgi:hypothetical protein